jgi:hypothetical protein
VFHRTIFSNLPHFRSGDCSDFRLEIFVFGVKGFLEVKLGLEADEEIPRDAEAELDAQGEVLVGSDLEI